MRFFFSFTGLLILLVLVYAAGSAGLHTVAHGAADFTDGIQRITGEPKSSSQSPKTVERTPAATQSPEKASSQAATDHSNTETTDGPSASQSPDQQADSDAHRGDVPDVAEVFRSRSPAARTKTSSIDSRYAADPQQSASELRAASSMIDYRALPEGVSGLRMTPDGQFDSILAKGTASVPRSLGAQGRRIAISRAGLRARAALAQYLSERMSCRMKDNNHVEIRLSGTARGEPTEQSSDRSEIDNTIVLTSEAILRGTVSLYEEVLAPSEGGYAIVVVGISSKTLVASLALQGRIDPGTGQSPLRSAPAGSDHAADDRWVEPPHVADAREMGFENGRGQ